MSSCCIEISFSSLAPAPPGTFIFRGYIDCSTDPNYPPANSGDLYVVSGLGPGNTGRIGGPSGALVEDGDQVTAINDNAGGTQAAVGSDWSIAQANITYTPENVANKDAANGYVGLTGFNINFKNILGTFMSFFTNSNTAARTYTFQDRNGTIADDTDLAGKLDVGSTTADVPDSLDKRYVTDANLTVINNTSGTNTGNETTTTMGTLIDSSLNDPIADADKMPFADSSDSWIMKAITMANFKIFLRAFFDTLYPGIGDGAYIGSTFVANNRASAPLTLQDVSIDGNAATATLASTVTTNANLTGHVTSSGNSTTISSAVVTEAMQTLSDNTTQDVTTSRHGYAPKAPNDATKFLNGTGAWSVPTLSNAPRIHVRDEKSSGTDAGSFNSGSYITRTLNTTIQNTITGASLSSNQIILPAGSYLITARAPAVLCGSHKCKFYNVTDAADVVIGSSRVVGTTGSGNNDSLIIEYPFSIASQKTFELRHRCSNTRATDGLGSAAGFGDVEVYAEVIVEQVG